MRPWAVGSQRRRKIDFDAHVSHHHRPTAGTIFWNGQDVVKSPDTLRAVLGYLPQDFGVYPNLNAVEFLEYMAAIKGLGGKSARRRIDELLQVVNLVEAARRPLGGYSGGMKQRVGIAQALLNDPQLLIVDEPTVGLDPEERVRFRNLLADLSSERIILLSTHIVSDVEAIATDIVIIDKGQLLCRAAPEDLLQSLYEIEVGEAPLRQSGRREHRVDEVDADLRPLERALGVQRGEEVAPAPGDARSVHRRFPVLDRASGEPDDPVVSREVGEQRAPDEAGGAGDDDSHRFHLCRANAALTSRCRPAPRGAGTPNPRSARAGARRRGARPQRRGSGRRFGGRCAGTPSR